MTNVITVSNLRKTYRDVTAVADVSFDVQPGEIFGIIGPNGSGKTTTVECVQGLRTPDAGELSVLGLDPRLQGPELRRRIGSQLQESALPERIKVREALDVFASASHHRQDWRDVAKEWGIYERRDAVFANLSGGQRQRLFIALALISKPEIVFLDEMTTGLDPAARRVAWSLIQTVRERGATVVLVTHFMEEVEKLCDRVAVFKSGRLVELDTPHGLTRRRAPERVVRFSSDAADLAWLRSVPGVLALERDGNEVSIHGEGAVLARVAAALVERGIEPPDLRVEIPTLEEAYMTIVEAPEP